MRNLLCGSRGERGSVIILVAAALAGLLAFGAISVDAGLIYAERTRLNNVADAAALAGAVALAEYPDLSDAVGATAAANLAIDRVIAANGLTSSQYVPTISGKSVTVEVQSVQELTFARVLDIPTADVSASATADFTVPSVLDGGDVGNIVPLGVELTGTPQPGDPVILKDGGGSGTCGNFHLLALDGNGGVPSILAIFLNGYQGVLEKGDWIETAPGNKDIVATNGMEYRLASEETRIVITPIVSYANVNGKDMVQILGFAAFYLEGLPGHGGDNTITGHFIQFVVPKAGGGSGGSGGTDYGLRSVRLTR